MRATPDASVMILSVVDVKCVGILFHSPQTRWHQKHKLMDLRKVRYLMLFTYSPHSKAIRLGCPKKEAAGYTDHSLNGLI